MPSYVYTNVSFHLRLNICGSSRLDTFSITCPITIRYAYHSQYDTDDSAFHFYLLIWTNPAPLIPILKQVYSPRNQKQTSSMSQSQVGSPAVQHSVDQGER